MTNRAGNAMLGGSDSVGSAGIHARRACNLATHAREAGLPVYYKMSAAPTFGSTLVVWVVVGAPDYTGASAPALISGTAIVVATWQGS